MTIRRAGAWRLYALGAVLLAASACQSATDVEVSDLDGTWVATEARLEDLAGYKLGNIDLIGEGYNVAFSSPGDGTFALILAPPEGDPGYVIGTMEIDGTRAAFTTAGSTTEGEVFYDPDDHQLALSLTGGLTYDFSGNGVEVPAKLLVVMDRVSPEPLPL